MGNLSGLGQVLLFTGAGIVFILATLLVSRLISPSKPNSEKNEVYESGEEPVGSYWPAISNGYFVLALLFILFEIEVILLFPLAVVFGKSTDPIQAGILWVAISGFLIILVAGLAYAWAKGHLDWMKPKPEKNTFSGVVPEERYKAFNSRFK